MEHFRSGKKGFPINWRCTGFSMDLLNSPSQVSSKEPCLVAVALLQEVAAAVRHRSGSTYATTLRFWNFYDTKIKVLTVKTNKKFPYLNSACFFSNPWIWDQITPLLNEWFSDMWYIFTSTLFITLNLGHKCSYDNSHLSHWISRSDTSNLTFPAVPP